MNLDQHKKWAGSSFLEFYLKRLNTWVFWGSVTVGLVFTFAIFAYGGETDIVKQLIEEGVFWNLVYFFLGFGFLLGLVTSVTDAANNRERVREWNDYVDRVKNGKPVDAGMVTTRGYSVIEFLDDDAKVKIKTKVGHTEMEVQQIPDNRVEFPSFIEFIKSFSNQ